MTYDRFDDMRSKGIAGGGTTDAYDLTKIGTKVLATAVGNIHIGDKIEGDINSQFVGNTIYKTNASINTAYFSDDLQVAIPQQVSVDSNYKFNLYFNQGNYQYLAVSIDLPNTMTRTTYNTKINEEGTLAVLFVTSDSYLGVVMVEIDKDTQTATAYLQPQTITQLSRATDEIAILTKDYFLNVTKTTSSLRCNSLYKYNKTTHELQFIVQLNPQYLGTQALYTSRCYAWSGNSLIIACSYGVVQIDISGLSAQVYRDTSVGAFKTINTEGNLLASNYDTTNNQISFYSYNTSTHTATLIRTFSVGSSYRLATLSSMVGVLFDSYMILGLGLFDVSNITNNDPTEISVSTDNIQPNCSNNVSIDKWIRTGTPASIFSYPTTIGSYLVQKNTSANSPQKMMRNSF